MAAIKSLRVLVRLDFPTGTVRFWDGSGPFMDLDGNIWRGGGLVNGGLDAIEAAINAEAYTLQLGISGIGRKTSDIAWQETEDGDVIDAKVQILIQDCDEDDQPIGEPEVKFTGFIDDIKFDDAVNGNSPLSSVTIEVRNRFTLRGLTSGSVLSDVDQKARAGILNPGLPADRIAERISTLAAGEEIAWPKFD